MNVQKSFSLRLSRRRCSFLVGNIHQLNALTTMTSGMHSHIKFSMDSKFGIGGVL